MTNSENFERARAIVDKLELAYDGELYHCPNCGEDTELVDPENIYEIPDYDPDESDWDPADYDIEDYKKCPCCKKVFEVCDFEQSSLFDVLDEIYDTEYRIGGDGEYRSVCLMIACGGPSIYVDTSDNTVKLYWGGEKAEAAFSERLGQEIDSIYEEQYFYCKR